MNNKNSDLKESLKCIIEHSGKILSFGTIMIAIVSTCINFYSYVTDIPTFFFYNIDLRFLAFQNQNIFYILFSSFIFALLYYLLYHCIQAILTHKSVSKKRFFIYITYRIICILILNGIAFILIYQGNFNLSMFIAYTIIVLIILLCICFKLNKNRDKDNTINKMIDFFDNISLSEVLIILILVIAFNSYQQYSILKNNTEFYILENKKEAIVYMDANKIIAKRYKFNESENKIILYKNTNYIYNKSNNISFNKCEFKSVEYKNKEG